MSIEQIQLGTRNCRVDTKNVQNHTVALSDCTKIKTSSWLTSTFTAIGKDRNVCGLVATGLCIPCTIDMFLEQETMREKECLF